MKKYFVFVLISVFFHISCSDNENKDIIPPVSTPSDTIEVPKETVKPFVIDKKSLDYAALIDSSKMRTIITILASDEFEGRTPDSLSIYKTETYLADYVKKINIPMGNEDSTYFQKTYYDHANLTNVAGLIEGSKYKDEYILLCAHFDHLGISTDGEVFYGADDNASGVSSLLEIGEMLA